MSVNEKLAMMDKAYKISKAMESGLFSELIVAVGLTDELLAGLSLEEIVEVTNVRVYDFTKQFDEMWGEKND
jgi:hypothetical protein